MDSLVPSDMTNVKMVCSCGWTHTVEVFFSIQQLTSLFERCPLVLNVSSEHRPLYVCRYNEVSKIKAVCSVDKARRVSDVLPCKYLATIYPRHTCTHTDKRTTARPYYWKVGSQWHLCSASLESITRGYRGYAPA